MKYLEKDGSMDRSAHQLSFVCEILGFRGDVNGQEMLIGQSVFDLEGHADLPRDTLASS